MQVNVLLTMPVRFFGNNPARGGMPMSSGLTATLSEFTRRSGFTNNPLAAPPPGESPAPPAKTGLLMRIRALPGELVSSSFPRYLLVFGAGVASTLAWQTYAAPARAAVAGWSPHLAWLAPASRGVSADRVKAASLALAAMHRSVDRLAGEVGKLEAGTAEPAPAMAAPPRSWRSSRP
jgi:hypothetical protein